ncbi:Dyp-type peroxidase domain-containing protein [Streptomyces sp. YIM 98790]|uniref:Dyp-type peroxidase n=1 Tax=Streptomyces sp. YIM 98790 TaxID=2689077 RepID=UPI00140C6B5C|nr:Dyp-type peroxidase domain-containing protein [Streptomyces sp. YIM 98790]
MTMEAVRVDFDKETGIGPTDPQGEFDQEEKRLLADIQGNILRSHGRDHSRHLFIRFDPARQREARTWLAGMAGRVTSAMDQWNQSRRRDRIFARAGFGPVRIAAGMELDRQPSVTLGGKAGPLGVPMTAGPGSLPGVSFGTPDADGGRPDNPEAFLSAQLAADPSPPFVCLMLSAPGYRALGLTDMPRDEAFRRGSRADETRDKLCDPPAGEWHPGFQEACHALVIVADDDAERVQRKADEIRDSLQAGGAGEVAHQESGKVIRMRPNGPPREHFGFADGVSEPLFFAKDIAKAGQSETGRKWDPGAPLKLVLTKDPGGHRDTGFGSYFVYRKLEQDVPKFNDQRFRLAEALARADGRDHPHEGDKELAGAYMVGRFRDGMPVHLPATPRGTDDAVPNDFDFSEDKQGLKCPYQSHIRKTNPRGDTVWRFNSTLKDERTRRIARRAISYESEGTVGLLFLCAQSDISHQFEFMQQSWCNNINFLEGGDGKPATGQDPVVGIGSSGTAPRWPEKYGRPEKTEVGLAESVRLRGAEYFFAPSRSFLSSVHP